MQKFTDPRLLRLNDEDGIRDDGMRAALTQALEPTEAAVASYSVSAHIWVQAVLTDRALLLVRGAVRAKVTRIPFPLEITRPPGGSKGGVRIRTPHGEKTLWGSKVDPRVERLLAATAAKSRVYRIGPAGTDRPIAVAAHDSSRSGGDAARTTKRSKLGGASPTEAQTGSSRKAARQARKEARRAAGRRPRKPRRAHIRKPHIAPAPPAGIWELADNCIKCGRPLTDPRSRLARVGTRCIQIYGSQQRQVPNPAYSVWLAHKTKADTDYIAAKVRADAEFTRAMAAYEHAKAEWRRARSTK